VAAIDAAVPLVENYSSEAQADDDFAREVMLRHGIPEEIVAALQSVSRAFRAWGARAQVTRPLGDGEALALRDRTLHVHHRPGHSPTDTVFHDRERRMLIAGDHLLGHISSNPLITRPRDGSSERPQALIHYLNSLAATREMDIDLVLPGHGDPITDHRALIDQRLALHRRRADKIHGLLAQRPRSAYELAQALWGNIAVTQAYLTLSEVLGHLDLLANERRVREVERDGVSVFEAL
jgi:glyoxylase-like metal-dependent hydrolase (beta-lactamase superfamily II)